MRTLLAIVAVAAAGALPAAAATPRFDHQSWLDAAHGWASAGTTVYASDDGGRRWRRILRAGADVVNLQRTSPRAGFVATERFQLVTADAGGHWFFANGNAALGDALGRGHTVLWSGATSVLEQLRSWPPRLPRCRSRWIGDPGVLTAGPRPRNICEDTFVHLSSRVVYSLRDDPDSFLVPAALVPGGVAAFVVSDACGEFCAPEPERVLVYRNGRGLVRTLPSPPQPVESTTPATILVDWPRLVVPGDAGYAESDDGGATWRYVGG